MYILTKYNAYQIMSTAIMIYAFQLVSVMEQKSIFRGAHKYFCPNVQPYDCSAHNHGTDSVGCYFAEIADQDGAKRYADKVGFLDG